MTVYDKIKTVADEKKMSIRSIERGAGLSNGTIKKWLTCSPSVKNLDAVATVLGVSIVKLLGD